MRRHFFKEGVPPQVDDGVKVERGETNIKLSAMTVAITNADSNPSFPSDRGIGLINYNDTGGRNGIHFMLLLKKNKSAREAGPILFLLWCGRLIDSFPKCVHAAVVATLWRL